MTYYLNSGLTQGLNISIALSRNLLLVLGFWPAYRTVEFPLIQEAHMTSLGTADALVDWLIADRTLFHSQPPPEKSEKFFL